MWCVENEATGCLQSTYEISKVLETTASKGYHSGRDHNNADVRCCLCVAIKGNENVVIND